MSQDTAHHLFVSYSHADRKWLEKLQTHLKGLALHGSPHLDCWDDTRIKAGDRWRDEIETALSRATAAILLLSPHFLASAFIAKEELPRLLEKAAGNQRVFVLLISACPYENAAGLSDFQFCHDPSKPLARMSKANQDEVLTRLMRNLKALPPRTTASPPTPKPPDAALTTTYHPYTPALPPHFVGRQAELHTLAQALDAGHSVSLVGDWRIGKSSLLGTWAQQARQRGREVRLLSGEKPEGASVAALVQHITGHAAPADPDLAADQLHAWAVAQTLPPLVLLDEAAALLRQPEAGRFWSRVRGMLEQCLWILATREPISDTSPDSPLLNRLSLLRLALLSPDAAEQLIHRHPWPAPEPAELMRTWAGRHPYFLQLLGHHLQRHAPDWQAGREQFSDEADQRLKDLWKTLHAAEQETLAGWARSAGKEQIRRKLRQRGLLMENSQPFGQVLVDWLEGNTP